MIKVSLHEFCDRVMEDRRIDLNDVRALRRSILADGIASREEADLLVALDRAVVEADPAWGDYLVEAVVEFVVWTSRPTAYVRRDAALWLATSLGCGTGPTANGARVAFEVVREAQQVHEALLAFVLSTSPRRLAGSTDAAIAAAA